MKLSEIKGEAALDAIVDIIDPVAEIAMDKDFVKDMQSGKPRLLLVKQAIKKHKDAVFKILAILDQKTVEDYKKTVNLVTLPQQILEVLNDPEMAVLFGSQSQETVETSVGSVSESTGALKE